MAWLHSDSLAKLPSTIVCCCDLQIRTCAAVEAVCDGCQLDKSLCSYVFDAKLWISFKVFRLAVSFRMYCWVSHLLACIANMCCTVFSSALSNLQCLGRLSTISWWISWLWLSTIFITTNSVPSPFAARRMANGHPILYVHCCGHHFAQRLSVLHYDSYVLANSI